MAEIAFYHLTRTPLDQALPKLLGRVLAGGGRALVLCGSEERVAALDAALWLSAATRTGCRTAPRRWAMPRSSRSG